MGAAKRLEFVMDRNLQVTSDTPQNRNGCEKQQQGYQNLFVLWKYEQGRFQGGQGGRAPSEISAPNPFPPKKEFMIRLSLAKIFC